MSLSAETITDEQIEERIRKALRFPKEFHDLTVAVLDGWPNDISFFKRYCAVARRVTEVVPKTNFHSSPNYYRLK